MERADTPRGAEFPHTHRVAASAYIFRAGRLLLMRRTNPPRVYAPVGGHLLVDEDPLVGLAREVMEETGLTVDVLAIAGAWFGSIDSVRPPILGLDYVAESVAGDITLELGTHGLSLGEPRRRRIRRRADGGRARQRLQAALHSRCLRSL